MSNAPQRAMVMAAGLGTRMRPLTDTIPKPLISVQNVPLIDWCIRWLHAARLQEIVVNTAYLAEKLHAHLDSQNGIHVSYEGEEPLETGGGIAHALPQLGNAPFVAMNSDAIFLTPNNPHPIQKLYEAWDDSSHDFMMLLVPRAQTLGWEGKGDFTRTEDGLVRRPKEGEVADYVFTGVELIHPRVFVDLPDGAFSLSKLWQRSRNEDDVYTRVGSVVMDGTWVNVGEIGALSIAEDALSKHSA